MMTLGSSMYNFLCYLTDVRRIKKKRKKFTPTSLTLLYDVALSLP